MIHIESKESLKTVRSNLRGSIGFVPTMGALHDGHLSLIQTSLSMCDTTWVSIFVNPAQFSPNEDFNSYPRHIDQDLELCKAAGVDAVFCPTEGDIYPNGDTTPRYTPPTWISQSLCGKTRPHFFNGVCNVVERLFSLVHPTHAFFGNKDLQQRVIIEQMVASLNLEIDIVGCPIIRDKEGLALSSRNLYLDDVGLKKAGYISKALNDAAIHVKQQGWSTHQVRQFLAAALEGRGLKGDYVEVFRPHTGEVVIGDIAPGDHCCVAFICDGVRLIDNISLT